MKIVIIYGSPRKGITYETVRIVKEEIKKQGEVEFIDFHLPQDAPAFCKGCFRCIEKGESQCPDAGYIKPIVAAMMEADGFIISTPVYVLQISGGLKAFFDHLGFCYINHRPRFFNQKALVIATTAGAGLHGCIQYIKKNLSFWGVNYVYSLGFRMMASKWSDIRPEILVKATKRLQRMARIFHQDLHLKKTHAPSFIQITMFHLSRLFMFNYEPLLDKEYWQKKGWLDPGCNYLNKAAKPGVLKNVVSRMAMYVFRKMIRLNPSR